MDFMAFWTVTREYRKVTFRFRLVLLRFVIKMRAVIVGKFMHVPLVAIYIKASFFPS